MSDSEIKQTPSTTPDFRTELAAQLSDLVPEAIADGKVDVAKLKELLDEDAGSESERFGLFWPGKRRALKAAQEPTTATLKPCPDLSKDWDTTQNVFIEGDNLEVLKILQRHYHCKIKMIYIDPPYNTGKDFIYPDNYKEGLQTYLEFTKQVDEGGKKLSTNSESEGRYHSNWLNMMYPRLKLARNLLTQDGVMFISIDDHEIDNLLKLCNEVFGEGNLSTTFIRQKKKKPSFLHSNVGSMTEYVVCMTRNKKHTFPFSVDVTTAGKKYPLNNAGNSVGTLTFPAHAVTFAQDSAVYEPQDMSEGSIVTRLLDKVVIEGGRNVASFRLEGEWRYSQARLDEAISAGEGITISKVPFRPNHVKAGGKIKKMHNLLTPSTYRAGTNEDATEELDALLGGSYFNNPKPTSLIRILCQAVTYDAPDALVLDFFSGSGTTADAVMQLNAADNGSRRCVQVQLPEPVDEEADAYKVGFKTIADLARKRIDLAGEKIKSELDEQLTDRDEPLDIGYRTYRLVDTNFAKWRVSSDVEPDALQRHLEEMRDSSDDEATADDLLTEILLKQGHSLTECAETVDVAGLDVCSVGDNFLLAYLDEHTKPTLEQLRALVDAAGAKIVILEDAFQGDDELKTNLSQLCKSKKIELWTV